MYIMMYMGSTRTQIYLTDDQRDRIDVECKRTGASLAEIVRVALDEYLANRTNADYQKILDETFGKYPKFEVPDRSEWDRDYG